MGGGISAVTVISITADITDIQLGANCGMCKDHFWHKRPWAKYCSPRCRTRAWRARQKPAVLDDKPADSPEDEERRREELLAWDEKRREAR
ncbi:hypothetical protein LCGC14_1924010 [marine sediment metagenome]|uniref:Uncharacterized protein n=1 Tax=marine sediment metagenome TaxID=412755 RepID=A0A0F9FQK6_9ZZZZ